MGAGAYRGRRTVGGDRGGEAGGWELGPPERGARRVVVRAGDAAAQARSRGSATTEGRVNGLNPAPGTRPVRVLSACGGFNPAPGTRPVA